MKELTRRSFLQLNARLAAVMGLGAHAIPALAEAVGKIVSGTAPLLWLQGQSCSGCSVSLLNSDPLTPARLITQYISLAFHQTLSAATGEVAVTAVNTMIEKGGYLLAIEGAIPAGMPSACEFGGEPFARQVARAARNAKAVVAVGTCAGYGGIPAAAGNVTGAVGLPEFLQREGVATPLIVVPGCPAHPDWIVGTLAHVLKFGVPELDEERRPKAFFSRLVHDQCPRFADYERERFAATFGEAGCLFKLGCAGPLTKADCSVRQWNSGTNFCIKAGAPCVGCASREFATRLDNPIYVKNPTNVKSL
jgi:hydrogenase small subunit